ncbi:MFS general substrate transporter [Rhodocollybia butyracea]|uniref:MFS general substrate transporter n=1 Tax=Rhodocollybia butyracea TaxID=206335 RepID=A0A9P5UFD6_9AGAR|nr:MFS general substrate transporter [Rhodocollybia butyracea]
MSTSDSTSTHREKNGHAIKAVTEFDVDIAAQLVSGDVGEDLDPQVMKKLLRKIDLHIMPLLCREMTFADKTSLGQSAVLGIQSTAHLSQNQFNWLSSVFYLTYLAFEYPQNLALQYFPVGKWMRLHAACHSFGGLFAVRFILGICEGAITPGFMIVTSMFYTRQEQNKRVGYWFLMNGFAVIFLGLVSFGLLHTKTPKFAPWQWLMIITGLITIVTSVCFWFLFPNSPTTAWFLTAEERVLAVRRIMVNQTEQHWKREQPKIWVMALFAAIAYLTNQRQLITTLLGCVDGAVEILSIWLGISLAGVTGIGRAYACTMLYIPCLLGALLVNLLPSHLRVGLLFGYWLSIFAFAPFAVFLGWVSGLVSGHTKRTTTNAIVLIGYAIGNFASPFIWKAKYQPRNHVPWAFLAASMGASVLLLLTLRAMLAKENSRRDRESYHDAYDNVYLAKDSGVGSGHKIDKALLDLTDLQNHEFRYTL